MKMSENVLHKKINLSRKKLMANSSMFKSELEIFRLLKEKSSILLLSQITKNRDIFAGPIQNGKVIKHSKEQKMTFLQGQIS